MPPNTVRVQDNGEVPATKLRNFRVDDDLWEEAARIAAENRESVSAVLKRALVEYVRAHGGTVTRP